MKFSCSSSHVCPSHSHKTVVTDWSNPYIFKHMYTLSEPETKFSFSSSHVCLNHPQKNVVTGQTYYFQSMYILSEPETKLWLVLVFLLFPRLLESLPKAGGHWSNTLLPNACIHSLNLKLSFG
jgi:hypothetical protein